MAEATSSNHVNRYSSGEAKMVSRHRPNLTNVLIGEDWTIWRIDFHSCLSHVQEPAQLQQSCEM
jgi:hypothetical protein